MSNVAEFIPFVLSYAPYTPSEIIEHAIRESIVEFMRESKIAVATTEIETQAKVFDYMLDLPECHRFLGVKRAVKGPVKCSGTTQWSDIFDGEYGDYFIELRKGSHPFLQLTHADSKPHFIRLDYYWAIRRDECDVPDFIYEDFMDTIVAGALIRLAGVPNHDNLVRTIQQWQMAWFDGVQRAKVEKTGGKPRRIISGNIFRRRYGRF